DDEAGHVEPRGRHDVEGGPVLALETVSGGGAGDQIAGRGEEVPGSGTEFQPVLAEHDENALRRRDNRSKAELEFACHGAWSCWIGHCSIGGGRCRLPPGMTPLTTSAKRPDQAAPAGRQR